jgi:hypothetical protein
MYRAEYSARYHRRRATFLTNLDTLLTLVTIVAGASAFAQLVTGAPGWLSKLGAATVTLISLAQVILRLGPQGTAHAQWMKRWMALQTTMGVTVEPKPEDVRDWTMEQAAIETECVGELRALRIDCEDITARVMAIPGRQHRIGRFQRLFFHFGTWQQEFPVVPDITHTVERDDRPKAA